MNRGFKHYLNVSVFSLSPPCNTYFLSLPDSLPWADMNVPVAAGVAWLLPLSPQEVIAGVSCLCSLCPQVFPLALLAAVCDRSPLFCGRSSPKCFSYFSILVLDTQVEASETYLSPSVAGRTDAATNSGFRVSQIVAWGAHALHLKLLNDQYHI